MLKQAIRSAAILNTDINRVSFICVMISSLLSPEEESLKYEGVGTINLFWKQGVWNAVEAK